MIKQGAFAYTSVSLYDGLSARQDKLNVVVENGRTTRIDREPLPDNLPKIDLSGCTIIPGMTVGHWHGEYMGAVPPVGTFNGIDEAPAVLALQAARAMKFALQSGVTRVVGGGCSNNLDMQMRRAIQKGIIDGPHIVPCSRYLNTTSDIEDCANWWNSPAPVQNGVRRIGASVFADGPDQITKAVREEISFGAEIIKLVPTGGHGFPLNLAYRGYTKVELAAAVDAAHGRGKRLRAHTSSKESILECIEAGVDIIDHGDFMDDECLDAMVKHGTTFLPSLFYTRGLRSGSLMGASQDLADLSWQNMREMLPKANKAGIRIVTGDDYGTPGMEHRVGIYGEELAIYVVEMGIPFEDVIKWTSVNGAELAQCSDETGAIRVGALADFIVVKGDPKADITLLCHPEDAFKAIYCRGIAVQR